MDALSPQVKDPWKPCTLHTDSLDVQVPRQRQQLPPAPLTHSPQCPQLLHSWHALAQPGCPRVHRQTREAPAAAWLLPHVHPTIRWGHPLAWSLFPHQGTGLLSRDSLLSKTRMHTDTTTFSSTALACQASWNISDATSEMGPELWLWRGGGHGCVGRNTPCVQRSVH